ncbi:amidohydrolase family protein [Oricola cellulosilytica]|uniref:Amidohydrolase n=1 Tax=Oricola cellulosilytica TaxID=1429082 RepID=A0A4R0PF29_9HYPH|nr:amidohydrolase family protein [Oricola cellulosilytica]TCD15393.1 amidohydrolase [Oricola cellulosilytica]
MTVRLEVDRWFPQPGRRSGARDLSLEIDGSEVAATSGSGGTGLLAMLAPVNAHDHGYGVRTLDFGCVDDALEPWIASLRLRPATDPYMEALVAFGRMLQSGCCATMHCHNSLHAERLFEEAKAVVRAARESGIRLALSCPLLDSSPWIYGDVEELRGLASAAEWKRISGLLPDYRPVGDQIAAVEEVARKHHGTGVDVQFGPIGPQWASNAMLEQIADASHASGRRIHMHLLESPRQRHWLDRRFPDGVVRHLDSIGFLSPRLAVAHGVQLRPDECDLLAERGVTVVTNPSANLRLRSGIAPLEALRRSGVNVAVGLDGTGFDDDQDIWREARLASLLHGGKEIDPAVTPAELFDAMTTNGAAVVNHPTGGDVVTVDYAEMTRDALFDDVDELTMILTRMTKSFVRDLVIAGKHVVSNGRIASFDFDAARGELLAQAKSALPELEKQRGNADLLAGLIRRYYRERFPQG